MDRSRPRCVRRAEKQLAKHQPSRTADRLARLLCEGSIIRWPETATNSAWIKRKEYSFAQYEHAHRLRLISEFFRLQDRHRGTACVFDTVGVEEG
jgi:hypothetical protein